MSRTQRICRIFLLLAAAIFSSLDSLSAFAQETPQGSTRAIDRIERDLLYREAADRDAGDQVEEALTPEMQERCRLDLYLPAETQGFVTIVWFHGGGLTAGEKSIPQALQGQGVAVVAAGYRLSPGVSSPAYLEDAAAAVAWTFRNIEKYGGDPRRIIVSGHSAGGYLAAMVGLDKRWLAAHEIDANRIAGLVPFSGQVITHFTIRAERGIESTRPVIDDMAPLYHVRADAPPLWLITGDREKELLGRYEENAYLWRMMKEVGHQQTEIFELEGFDHGAMAEPAFPLLLKFARQIAAESTE